MEVLGKNETTLSICPFFTKYLKRKSKHFIQLRDCKKLKLSMINLTVK